MIYGRYRSHASLTPDHGVSLPYDTEHVTAHSHTHNTYHVGRRSHNGPDYDFHRIEQALRRIVRSQR